MSSSLKEERKEEKIATSTAWNNMEQEAKQQEKEAEMKNSEVHFPPSYNQLFFTDVSSSIVASSVSSTTSSTNEEQCQQQVDIGRPISASNLVVLDVASTGSDPSINYVEMMLKEKYPVRYAVFHACILILSSVSAILLQIELIAQNGALNEVAAGIWCGVLGLLTSLIIFLNVKYRNYSLYNVSTLLNAVVAFVYLFGLVVINAIAMDSYSECNTLQICYNNAMFPLNVVFIGLGVFTFIHCFVFAVAVNCLIRKRSCHRCHTVCSSCFPSA